jgi:hypothetical protein
MKMHLGGKPFNSWPSPLLHVASALAEHARSINPPLCPCVPPLSLTLVAKSLIPHSLTLAASPVGALHSLEAYMSHPTSARSSSFLDHDEPTHALIVNEQEQH